MATIVAADDDPDILGLIGLKLGRAGHHVVLAQDGEQAMFEIAQHAPAIVLLDFDMPRMTGLQVLTALRLDPATRAVPVVIISANTDPVRVASCADLGIAAYIAKPFRLQGLTDRVAALLASDQSCLGSSRSVVA